MKTGLYLCGMSGLGITLAFCAAFGLDGAPLLLAALIGGLFGAGLFALVAGGAEEQKK